MAVGLIMGTRLWYAMWDAEHDSEAAFERRLDAVCREIGDRGKPMMSEAVPPDPVPAPAPVSTPAPGQAPGLATTTHVALNLATAPVSLPAPAPAAAPAPLSSTSAVTRPATSEHVTPTRLQVVPSHAGGQDVLASSSMSGSLGELGNFLEKQQRVQMERDEKLEAKMQTLETKMENRLERQEAQLEQQRQQLERQRLDAESKLEQLRQESAAEVDALKAKAARMSKVTSLQVRLEALHDAKLLEDDEISTIEDKIADAIAEAEIENGNDNAWGCVIQMIQLSEGIASTKMFCRQLRRKFM
jgi:hypothetical protein